MATLTAGGETPISPGTLNVPELPSSSEDINFCGTQIGVKNRKMFPALGIPLPLRKVAIFLSPTITISKESEGAFYLLHFNQNQENHHLIYATITGGAPSSWFQPSSVPPHHINISKNLLILQAQVDIV